MIGFTLNFTNVATIVFVNFYEVLQFGMIYHLFTCNINFCNAGFFIHHGRPSWAHDSSGLMKYIEIFEEVFASARDEAEYIANISARVKKIKPLQSGESNLLLSKFSGSGYGSFSAAERFAEQLSSYVSVLFIF